MDGGLVMDISTIKSQIKSKQLKDFYIFTGTEWKVQEIYIRQIAKCKGFDVKYIDSVTDIYSSLQNKSFLSKSYIYVVRDDKELMTNEKLQEKIKGELLGDNILILLLTSVDKRLKFYKAYKDTICEFEPLPEAMLIKYIQKEIDLSKTNCQKLIEVCESDYGRILLEIDKIKQYQDYDIYEIDHMADIAFEILLKDGTIYKPPKDAIFDFVNAILDRNVDLSYNLFEQCKEVGEATMVMLSVLYTNAKAVLQVQACESKDISKSTGLTGWQIKCAKEHTGNYSIGELVNILRMIQELESGIKIGKYDEQIAVDYLLVNIL